MKRPSLLTQVLAVNALLITATVFAASVAASLHAEPVIERKRFLVLVAALMAMVLLNGWLLRRRFAPLEELIGAMERLDFAGRDTRARIPTANVEEVARLHQAFDAMLARLEAERARTATAVLQAQEAERARLARDLHDEANQALTGVLLRLEATAQDAPGELRDELRETQRVATQAMGELVRLARELRPVALDDLGLGAALRTQVDDFGRRAGVRTTLTLPAGGRRGHRRGRAARRLPRRPGGPVERRPPRGRAQRARRRRARPTAAWSCGSPTTAAASRRAATLRASV